MPLQKDRPLLTRGLQTGDVIDFFPFKGGKLAHDTLAELWPWDDEHKGYEFRFFKCPVSRCGKPILLRPGPKRVDTLFCPECGCRKSLCLLGERCES
jgi:hypothetical protein